MTADDNKLLTTSSPSRWWHFSSWSLKTQFLVVFSTIIVVAGGLTLVICLGMVHALGDSVSSSADHVILKNTRSNAADLGNEIASTISLQLQDISYSICRSSALYASVLLASAEENVANGTIWKPARSYREFNFAQGCHEPYCPSDFGAIHTRSRIPYLPGYLNGSMRHSSVFLFDKRIGAAVRNTSAWNQQLNDHPDVDTVINALAYEDTDFRVLYETGPSSTVMFYLSAAVTPAGASAPTHVVHRTYPGIEKNQSSYDPSQRSWFAQAPINGTNVYGPYVESFTKQIVLTLSSKKRRVLQTGATVDVVAGAVLLIQDVASIIRQIDYPQGGFAALVTFGDHRVVVWRDDRDVYDAATGQFLTVADVDPALAAHDLDSNGVFSYADANGTDWVVTTRSLFASDTTRRPSFVVLVFANRHLAEAPLRQMNAHVSSTTAHVTTTTLVVVFATVGVVLCLVLLLVAYIAGPIERIRRIARDVVAMTAEDDDQKDFQPMLSQAAALLSRRDEIGVLCSDFYDVVCLLDGRLQQRRATPPFPANPLAPVYAALVAERAGDAAAVELKDVLAAYLAAHQAPPPPSSLSATGDATVAGGDAVAAAGDELDVLASMMPTALQDKPPPRAADAKAMAAMKTAASAKPPSVCASLRSQLSAVSLVLVAGLVIAMAVTVARVRREGDSWTVESGADLERYQLQNLEALALVKRRFVQTYFEQIALDLRVGATTFDALLRGDLARDGFVAAQLFFPSASIDPANTFYGGDAPSYARSGYFSPSDADCASSGTCGATQTANATRLTSLADPKLRAYFYADGATTFNAAPAACLISAASLDDAFCRARYDASKCGDPSRAAYPAYDARCRSWYTQAARAMAAGDALRAVFQYPRLSSGGQFVLTTSVAVADAANASAVAAVVSSNVLVTTLSAAVNELTVLASGYAFLVDARNASSLILHPRASAACTRVACAEGFASAAEYAAFVAGPLAAIEAAAATAGANTTLVTAYRKGGRTWRAVVSFVSLATVAATPTTYALVVTVPQREVDEAARDTQRAIDATVATMVAVFVVAIAVFVAALLLVTRRLIAAVVRPLDDVRAVVRRVVHDESDAVDEAHALPERASSLDMRTLLEAVAQLLVALRFGAEMFARGRHAQAEGVFRDALRVFRATENARGVGASLNNLAAVCLAQGRLDEAERLYREAIAVGDALLGAAQKTAAASAAAAAASASVSDAAAARRDAARCEQLARTLSDRRGNLAAVHLERGDFVESFALLEALLREDRARGYVRGCVVKQGTLGQFYLRQGELPSAARVFASADAYIAQLLRQLRAQTAQQALAWDSDEVHAAQQIARYNVGLVTAAHAKDAAATAAFAAALCEPPVWHVATAAKIVAALDDCVAQTPGAEDTRRLLQEAARQLHVDVFGEAGSLLPLGGGGGGG
eukprot:gene11918-8504_t